MIAVATTRAHIEGYWIAAYKGTAKGDAFAAFLRNGALGANAVLNTCFDDALDVETPYHGAAVVIELAQPNARHEFVPDGRKGSTSPEHNRPSRPRGSPRDVERLR